jgi:heptosyltransferase-3
MTPVKKLLIYRFGQIGDTVAALPALWLLRDHFPSAVFTLLSEEPKSGASVPPEKVLPGDGLIQRHIKYKGSVAGSRVLAMLRMALALRREKHDLLAYLLPTIRSPQQRARDAFFFRLAGFRQPLGFEGYPVSSSPRQPDGALQPVPHEADALLHRLARSGLPVVFPGAGKMDLGLSQQERGTAAAWLKQRQDQLNNGQRWFAVCSGSKWTSKQWPADRYAEVGHKLIHEQGLQPVIFGGAEDRELGQMLISRWQTGLCAAGELSVRESAALLEHASFYLGNDTGVMHLAAAVGTPCVAIFSALDWPGRWHPYGSGHRVLRHEVACAGCLLQKCDRDHQCLAGISAEAVYQACCDVLNARTAPG